PCRRDAVLGEARRAPPRPPSIISLAFRADRKPGAPGDEPRAALMGDVGPGPLEQDHEAIAKPDEKEDVDQEPPQPGNEPGELKSPDDGHRGGLPDRRDVALVAVAEALGRAAREPPPGVAGRGAAVLGRGRVRPRPG